MWQVMQAVSLSVIPQFIIKGPKYAIHQGILLVIIWYFLKRAKLLHYMSTDYKELLESGETDILHI